MTVLAAKKRPSRTMVSRAKTAAKKSSSSGKPAKPKLLSGGNPQIAKGYGDAPVQAYLAAMPGWKSKVGRQVDQLIERVVPGVRKAVKYNSPLYGAPGRDDWFLGVHVYERYIKFAFFRGAELEPVPPGVSKQKYVRYLNLGEGRLDAAQFSSWVRQASKLPGEKL